MTQKTAYTPVSCELHSRLELHTMHGDYLQMALAGPGGTASTVRVRPIDLITTDDKAEYLLAKDGSGAELRMRLDSILEFHPVAAKDG